MEYTLGLDVSHWNTVKWLEWKNHRFVYIKCTEGTGWVDDKWMAHQTAAGLNDFYTGPYHYFRAAWSGAAQAQHFYNTVSVRQWDMPPAVDVEKINNTGFTKEVFAARLKECLLEVERLFGRKPVIYTSKSKWEELVGSMAGAASYPLWVAHYANVPTPLIPSDWVGTGYKVWQYTSSPLDQNKFNGELNDFLEWIGVVVPPPGGGDLEVRVKSLEEKVANLEALASRLHLSHHV